MRISSAVRMLPYKNEKEWVGKNRNMMGLLEILIEFI